jgi:hypothetical protein
MPNNRIFYATRKAGIAPLGSTTYTTVRGMQSAGVTTNFNIEQVFEIGKLQVYQNVEGVPDVSIDLEKVLDGYSPMYTLATQQGTAPSLIGRSNARCTLAMSIYPDTNLTAEGTPGAEVQLSGLYVSSVGYNVAVGGRARETLSLVGNNKVWVNLIAGTSFASYGDGNVFTNSFNPKAIAGSGGVNGYESVLFTYAANPGRDINGTVSGIGTVLPQDIPGISSSGTNNIVAGVRQAHPQSVNASVDLTREDLFELGRRGPYFKFVNFPVTVTTEIAIIASSGDLVSCLEDGINAADGCGVGTNLSDRTIRLHMCEGLQLDLGKKNILSSVGMTGGDAGGGNVEVTYTYTNQNDFSVYHPQDPSRGVAGFSPVNQF